MAPPPHQRSSSVQCTAARPSTQHPAPGGDIFPCSTAPTPAPPHGQHAVLSSNGETYTDTHVTRTLEAGPGRHSGIIGRGKQLKICFHLGLDKRKLAFLLLTLQTNIVDISNYGYLVR